jgi:hypothetical protein
MIILDVSEYWHGYCAVIRWRDSLCYLSYLPEEAEVKKLLIVLLVTFSVVTAGAWVIETVDGGEEPSLALDSSDNPHISYTSSDSLKYASWDGSAWQIETVDTGVSYSELELDSADMPCIAYLLSDNSLKYARWDGSAWQIEVVDSGATSVSFELDSTDKPSIAYCCGSTYGGIVKYAHWDGFAWQVESIATDLYCLIDVRHSFDEQDKPRIAYIFLFKKPEHPSREYAALKQIGWDGSDWQTDFDFQLNRVYIDWSNLPRLISFTTNSSDHSCMLLANAAFPYPGPLLYWELDNGGTGVFAEQFYQSYQYGADFALSSQDYPHVAHIEQYSRYHEHWTGSSWEREVVSTNVNRQASITIDSLDKPHIAYGLGSITYAHKGINTPPGEFSLLAPADGGTVNDLPLCDWEDSTDSDGHDVTYDLWYSTDDTFGTYDEITDLTDSEYQFVMGELQNDTTYYWKVVATDSYDETWSTETWSFYVAEGVSIDVVDLASQATDEGVLLSWSIVGDEPASLSVLRSVNENQPITLSGELTGSATSWLDVSAEAGVEYAYYLEVTELNGTVSRFGPSEVIIPGMVSELALSDPYPNPASDSLTISYDLAASGAVELSIYDLSGRLVETLVSGEQTAGRHSVNWDSSVAATGVYLLRLEANGEAITKRAVISR